ncbi:MAG: Crp/Fnr family transcriptional regulator [Nitrospirae bacterium]|nr:Crp/Fnr family transcriptional regulator [Nitrospirota bacterium]MBF0618182.1 Crp/Fnr family transcriptional regulator [Nitrospirota bacterium]
MPLLSCLSVADIEQISNKILIRKYKKDVVLVQHGSENKQLYMILTGKVKVNVINDDGKDVTIAVRGIGEYFGEMSLIDNQTTSATVIAVENTLVAIMSKNDFWLLVSSEPSFVHYLMTDLCSKVREANDIIKRLTYNKAEQRIKAMFQRLASKFVAQTPNGIKIEIQVTHQDIADMTGLFRETVTSVLAHWRKEGYILDVKKKYYYFNTKFFENDFIL